MYKRNAGGSAKFKRIEYYQTNRQTESKVLRNPALRLYFTVCGICKAVKIIHLQKF